jgi:hypothetical protein
MSPWHYATPGGPSDVPLRRVDGWGGVFIGNEKQNKANLISKVVSESWIPQEYLKAVFVTVLLEA